MDNRIFFDIYELGDKYTNFKKVKDWLKLSIYQTTIYFHKTEQKVHKNFKHFRISEVISNHAIK